MATCPTLAGSSWPLVLSGRLQVGKAQEDLLQRDLAHGVVVHGVLLLGLLQNTKHLAGAEKWLLTSPGAGVPWLVWESSGHVGGGGVRLPEVLPLPQLVPWGTAGVSHAPGGGGEAVQDEQAPGARLPPNFPSSDCKLGHALWASFLFCTHFFLTQMNL